MKRGSPCPALLGTGLLPAGDRYCGDCLGCEMAAFRRRKTNRIQTAVLKRRSELVDRALAKLRAEREALDRGPGEERAA